MSGIAETCGACSTPGWIDVVPPWNFFCVRVSLNGEELTWLSRIDGYGHPKDIIWSSHHMVQSRQNVPEVKSRKEISQIKR
jgi:hypothetical protein